MRSRTILVIAGKDLREALTHRATVLPLSIVPLLFLVLLPLAAIEVPKRAGIPPDALLASEPIKLMLEHMPSDIAARLQGLDAHQTFIVLITCYALLPLFLILPLMVASVIGASSFAGEKERKTLEGLLHTPASDLEILAGKCLAAVVPAVALAWVGFVLYAAVVNAAGWGVMGRLFFPPGAWVTVLLWLVPAVAGFGTAIIVLVSSRVRSFMDAQQLGSAMVVPLLVLLAGQLTGRVYFNTRFVLASGLVIWAADAFLLWFGARTMSRDALATKL